MIAVVGLSIYAWWAAHSTVIRTIQIPVDNLQTPSRIIFISQKNLIYLSCIVLLRRLIKLMQIV